MDTLKKESLAVEDEKQAEQQRTVIAKGQMLAALEQGLGIVSVACKLVGVSRSVHYNWMKDDDNYRMSVVSLSEVALDFAESKLMKLIENGDNSSTIFFLKTKGKKRGYIERSEFAVVDPFLELMQNYNPDGKPDSK